MLLREFMMAPDEMALVMAALALVGVAVLLLHYELDRRAMKERLQKLEALLRAQQPLAEQATAAAELAVAKDASASGREDEDAADALPPGIRFV